MKKIILTAVTSLLLLLPVAAHSHDLWSQSNTSLVRTGEVVHVGLCLGNHGNHHRDFMLAGRVSLDWIAADLVAPDGTRLDLRGDVTATASAEKEGYWSCPVIPETPGVYCIAMSLDRVMQHGKSIRGVRTAKSYFLASETLDNATLTSHSHDQPLGLPFELVLKTCPFTETQAGQPIIVQVLHQGKPISDVVVSFVPQGTTLAGDFDSQYEFRTNNEGVAKFVPTSGNRYLIVAHHTAEDEKSDEYESTSYASTITLHVPVKNPLASR